jgi:hypothetical protein
MSLQTFAERLKNGSNARPPNIGGGLDHQPCMTQIKIFVATSFGFAITMLISNVDDIPKESNELILAILIMRCSHTRRSGLESSSMCCS